MQTEKPKPTGHEQFRAVIAKWRADGGTDYSAAAKAGLSPTVVSHVYRGLMPTPGQREKIRKAFGISVESWGQP